MTLINPTINPLGKQAILISWEEKIDENLLYFILEAKKAIRESYDEVNIEVINTYNSLLINYPTTIRKYYNEKLRLEKLISSIEEPSKQTARLFQLPVCYDEAFGIDLGEVSTEKKLTKPEIIALHTAPVYTVFFTGFLPGFLYLGGLDKKLHISRKKEPRLKVKKGAVGLAEKQTGIYPQVSAGGWQIIGNCPIVFFDSSEKPPSPFRAGDKLKFEPVSKEKYDLITAEIEKGNYNLNPKSINL